MKTVATLAQQIDDLSLHLRTIRANVRRATKELDASFSRRTRRPFESSLRWRRYQDATDLQMIAEACLHDLRKAQAFRLAPFHPGDQVIATLALKDFTATETRYGIWDIEPNEGSSYSYEAVRITKSGALSKRLDIQPLLVDRFSFRTCDAPLQKDSVTTLEWRREVCDRFLAQTINTGSLDAFGIEQIGLFGRRSIKRRT